MNGGSSLELDPELKTGSGRDTVIGLARHKLGGQSTKRKEKDQSESCLHKDQARASDSPLHPTGSQFIQLPLLTPRRYRKLGE